MTRRIRRVATFSLLMLLGPRLLSSQSAPPDQREDTQVWTAIEASHPLNEHADFVLSGAFRLGREVSHPVYERFTTGVAVNLHGHVTLTPLYSYVASQPLAGQDIRENRVSLEGIVDLPVGRWGILQRHVIERRFRDSKDSTRYHLQIQVERPVRLFAPLELFARDEVLYDWSFRQWIRNRISLGVNKQITTRSSIELFYVRQNARFIRPSDLNAFGLVVRTRF